MPSEQELVIKAYPRRTSDIASEASSTAKGGSCLSSRGNITCSAGYALIILTTAI